MEQWKTSGKYLADLRHCKNAKGLAVGFSRVPFFRPAKRIKRRVTPGSAKTVASLPILFRLWLHLDHKSEKEQNSNKFAIFDLKMQKAREAKQPDEPQNYLSTIGKKYFLQILRSRIILRSVK